MWRHPNLMHLDGHFFMYTDDTPYLYPPYSTGKPYEIAIFITQTNVILVIYRYFQLIERSSSFNELPIVKKNYK